MSVNRETLASTSTVPLTVLTENDCVPGSKLDKEPSEYSVQQLKRWLKCRGLKQSGKRNEILKRVEDCIQSGNHNLLDVSIDDGKWFAAKVVRENVNLTESKKFQNVVFTPVIPTSGWKVFQSQDIPVLFNYGHIYYYALESVKTIQGDEDFYVECEQGLGHMTDKPLKNGRKYVDSGFVHDLMDTKADEHYFARAHVWPSMRNEYPHNVVVILSVVSGAVIHASCQPYKVAALGRCSHIVAVLFYILDHVQQNGPTLSLPCTSKECSWDKGKKRNKNPQKLADTAYPTKRKSGKMAVIDFDPRLDTHRHVDSEHINRFVKDMQSISVNSQDGLSMWETQLRITYQDYELNNTLSCVLREQTRGLLENLTTEFLGQIPGTEKQSDCDKWFQERWLRLTASK